MKQSLASLLLGVALAVSVSGCGGAATPESLAKDSIAQINELATVLEDAKSVDDAKPKVDAIMTRFTELKKQVDVLKLPEAKQKELEASFKPEMDKAVGRMMSAMMKIAVKDPTGMEKLGESMRKIAVDKK